MNTHPTHSTTIARRPGRTPSPTDAWAFVGQILPPARPGNTGRICHTWYMHLPHGQATLDGPFGEVAHITRMLMTRGEIVRASLPTPSANGVMVTIQFTTAALRPGAARGRAVRRRWTARRRAVFAGSAASVAGLLTWAGYLTVTWTAAHPLAILAALAVLALGVTSAGRRVCQTAVTVIHRH